MESIWKAEETEKHKNNEEDRQIGNNKGDKNDKYESGILDSDKNEPIRRDKGQSIASSETKNSEDCLLRLADKRQWDVIVIGAGMAGILTAWYLQQEGKQVLVLEAKEIASGQTQNTTAKITSQHGLKYQKLIRMVGRKKAQLYALANEQAIDEYEKLIQSKKIDCDFERRPAYLYSKEKEDVLRKEAQAAADLGIRAKFMEESELCIAQIDTEMRSVVCFENQAQFSPLKFVQAIAKELNILEYTEVLSVKGHKVIARDELSGKKQESVSKENAFSVDKYKKEKVFFADKIVMATHYPFKNFPGFYFLRQHQERSYVLALTGCQPIHGMYYGIDQKGLSLRQAGEYLLLGGGAHRTGKSKARDSIRTEKNQVGDSIQTGKSKVGDTGRTGNNENVDWHQSGKNYAGGAYDFLENAAVHYFPEGNIVAGWSAQDCMPHAGIPFIGKFSIFTPNLYVATGFQKWGMTSSMAAALLLRDEICGYENPYKTLFRPQRMHIRASAFKLLEDVWVSICGLTKGFLQIFYKKVPRCPHMGCALIWNPDEKSWDCQCHGSRFDENGKLLDNPAQRNL